MSRQVWANLFEPAFGNLLERPTEKSLLVHGGARPSAQELMDLVHATFLTKKEVLRCEQVFIDALGCARPRSNVPDREALRRL